MDLSKEVLERLIARSTDIVVATDRKGNVFRLADLKGKKALIVTWSSW